MLYPLLARGIFSFASGLTIAVVGFGCDSMRELFDRLSAETGAYPASSAINMGLSVALVTGVQVNKATWSVHRVYCNVVMEMESAIIQYLHIGFRSDFSFSRQALYVCYSPSGIITKSACAFIPLVEHGVCIAGRIKCLKSCSSSTTTVCTFAGSSQSLGLRALRPTVYNVRSLQSFLYM